MAQAFGLEGSAVAVGTAWRIGDAVLKPMGMAEDELAWQADVYETITCDGFRVAPPLRATDGTLGVDGWMASRAVSGRHERGRWAEIIAVGERFHAALAGAARPGFIDRRTNPWAVADRVAWGEMTAEAETPHLARLASVLRPVDAPSQLIHGDLTGNVLFDDDLPPAILDFSPYWRPPPYAAAIVVADALTWEGADAALLDTLAHILDLPQYLVRALIFRVVADRLLGGDGKAFAKPVALACRRAG